MLKIKQLGYVAALILIISYFFHLRLATTATHPTVLATCTTHIEGHVHYHAQLHIQVDKTPVAIPADIGITNCMHPVHTHDDSGLIHIDYKNPYPFTLDDFFTLWGVVFTKDQVAKYRTADGYRINLSVNGRENHDFEKYVLQDNDTIDITINSVK